MRNPPTNNPPVIELLTAKELAQQLRIPQKSVYDLPIPRIKLSSGRVRWCRADVDQFLAERVTHRTRASVTHTAPVPRRQVLSLGTVLYRRRKP